MCLSEKYPKEIKLTATSFIETNSSILCLDILISKASILYMYGLLNNYRYSLTKSFILALHLFPVFLSFLAWISINVFSAQKHMCEQVRKKESESVFFKIYLAVFWENK